MDVEAGSFGKPVPDAGGLMRSVVVHHDMDIEFSGNIGFNGMPETGGTPGNGGGDATARSRGWS